MIESISQAEKVQVGVESDRNGDELEKVFEKPRCGIPRTVTIGDGDKKHRENCLGLKQDGVRRRGEWSMKRAPLLAGQAIDHDNVQETHKKRERAHAETSVKTGHLLSCAIDLGL